MSAKEITLSAGDVFEMPLSDGRLGYGVIVLGGGVPYVIILRSIHRSRPAMAALISDEIALVGETMDALIHHGRWTIIFHGYPSRSDVPFPNWKVGIRGELFATDFSGRTILGPLRPEEVNLLDYKFSRSPIAYQQALEAIHGLRECPAELDKLTPAYAAKRMTRS